MSTVHLTGTVHPDGHFTSGWWGSAPADALRPSGRNGGWAAAALDESGHTLAIAPAPLTAVPICPGSGEVIDRLSAFLPLLPGTAIIAVRRDDTEVFRRPVPEPAVVALDTTGLHGRTLPREPVQVPVLIDGPPPPTGAHLVARWEAAGQPASPLGLLDVGGGERPVVRLNLAELPGGDGCRLSVSYSDGTRTTTVSSPPLTVETRPVSLAIGAPGPETIVHDTGVVLLEGLLDGDGDAADLEWLFDTEPVGRGRRAYVARPDAGRHTVTLRYGTESVEQEITVQPAPARLEPPRWEPPWRTGPVRSIGVPDRTSSP
jgi:hypothetical protein